MGTKYSTVTISGFDSSPPPDDGTQVASNLVTWSGIKSKLATPIKTQAAAIDTALVAALNTACRAISSNDSTVANDHWKTLEVSAGATVTLLDAATAAAGYTLKIVNVGTSVVRITRATAGDFINGVAVDLNLNPGDSVSLKVNAAANGYVIDGGNNVDVGLCNGRISAHATSAVPTSDVSSSTSVFFIPYNGNKISLFDGTGTWATFKFGIISVACPSTSSIPFDVFAYNNAGVVALETATWTNASSRATGITLQDGVLVKVGALTRRYLGTCCTIATPGNIEDTFARRFVWNYYNRLTRPMKVVESTDTWTYSSATFRQANNNVANQLAFVVGVEEEEVSATVAGSDTCDTLGQTVSVGIGIDSSTVNSATIFEQNTTAVANTIAGHIHAFYEGFPGIGLRTLRWLEAGSSSGVTTWHGDNASNRLQNGITGRLRA